jgi:hypothetical protein
MAILRIRRGTTTQWAASTRELKLGELGIDTTLNKIKAGNGTAIWNNLPYINVLPQEFADAIASIDNTLGESFVQVSSIGVADGLATLGADGKIPDSEIPAAIARDTEVASAISTAISNLVNSSPEALNTLKELSDALGADANFATTVSTALGNKLNSSDAATSYLPLAEPSVDYYITNSGTGSYLVNGVSNGIINFQKGKKYRIVVNAVGHPFWIQTVPGAYSLANVYSTGITNGGTANGRILVELPQSAPNNLYYVCEYHPSMNGKINSSSLELLEYEPLSSATSYTITSANSSKMTEFTASTNVAITIPSDPLDATWPIGSSLELRQMGTGRLVFSATSPATIVSTDGYLKTRAQYSSVFLEKRGSNAWILTGDIDA